MLIKELGTIVRLLETYRGRDRAIRLTTYVAMFMGGAGKTPAQIKWKTIATEMGACRVILRLFDDLPMLLFNLSTGFGLKGTKPQLKPLELFTSLLNQGFYPVEHIAWLRQKGVLQGPAVPFLLLGLFIWAVTLLAEIFKSIVKLRIIAAQAKTLVKQKQLDKDMAGSSSQNAQIKENLKKLHMEKKDVMLGIIQSSCDLTNAISWCPPGFLWSQKLPARANGVFGLIATGIMLYRNWPSSSTAS